MIWELLLSSLDDRIHISFRHSHHALGQCPSLTLHQSYLNMSNTFKILFDRKIQKSGERTDGRTNVRTAERSDGRSVGLAVGCMDCRTGRTGGRADRRTVGRSGSRRAGRTGRRTYGQSDSRRVGRSEDGRPGGRTVRWSEH